MSITRVVAITGCDSGLGWALAARSAREGLVTVAGMYNGPNTAAAQALRKLCAHTCPLDVTKQDSVNGFREYVGKLLKENPEWKLHAVVNNAGIMAVGEFECQTAAMVAKTIDVNLLGAMRVASALLPELRRSAAASENTLKPRVINIASHCGLQPLPGFGPYSASKAGVLAWTKALRVECRDHGLAAVAYVPGGFITSSNLVDNQEAYTTEMLANLEEDQKSIYEQKIRTISSHLSAASQIARFDSMTDETILETFMKALLLKDPKMMYKVECWRYSFYYNLLKLPMPEALHCWLLKKFIRFPK